PPLPPAASDAPEFLARPRYPCRRPERLEPFDRRVECLRSGTLLTPAPPHDAERKESPSPPVLIADLLVLGDRAREKRVSLLAVAAGRSALSAASGHVCKHPVSPDPLRVGFPLVDDVDGIADPVEAKQRLDMVAAPPADARLLPVEPHCRLVCPIEPAHAF